MVQFLQWKKSKQTKKKTWPEENEKCTGLNIFLTWHGTLGFNTDHM